jgi:cation diffusion facilitator family transporter
MLMFASLRNVPRAEARAAMMSLALSILLLGLKLTAYMFTGSSAIFSDALETVVNVVAAGFALYALSVAHTPADKSHPYGHGKIEFVSAALEGLLIIVAAAMIFMRTLDTLRYHRVHVDDIGVGLVMLLLAILGNGALGNVLIRTGRRIHSMTLEADGKHLRADAVTSIAAAIALVIVGFTGWVYADPIIALLIAAYFARLGVGLLRRAGGGLMDRQDTDDEQLIDGILRSHVGAAGKPPFICSFHKLRHRHSGRYHWVDFHIMVDPTMSIGAGHNVASAIEYEIEQALGEGNATAHIEPCNDSVCVHAGGDLPKGAIPPAMRETSDAQNPRLTESSSQSR